MDNYNIRFGEEIGEQAGLTMVDLLAKKSKAAIKQKKCCDNVSRIFRRDD